MKKLNIFFLIFASLVASCHHDHEGNGGDHEEVDEVLWQVSVNKVTSVNWKVSDDTHTILSTMTVIGEVPNVIINEPSTKDVIAFFDADECLGVTSPEKLEDGRWVYYFNIYQPNKTEDKVTLGYFSDNLKQAFYWPHCLEYHTDAIVGTMGEPFSVNTLDATTYPLVISADLNLPANMLSKTSSKDVLGVFSGDQCRGVLTSSGSGKYRGTVHMIKVDEELTVQYFCATEKRVYKSISYPVHIGDAVFSVASLELK